MQIQKLICSCVEDGPSKRLLRVAFAPHCASGRSLEIQIDGEGIGSPTQNQPN